MSTKKKHISLKVTIKNRKQINFVWEPLILPNFSRHTNLACKGVQIRSLTLHQFESLSIRIGFLFSIIIKNIFDLHYPWVTNKAKALQMECFFRFVVIPYAHRPIFKMQSHFELGDVCERCQWQMKRTIRSGSRPRKRAIHRLRCLIG